MEKDIRFAIGDKVMVMIPFGENTGSAEMKKYNGRSFYISRMISYEGTPMYELAGVKSHLGVPFTFMRDWLQPMEVE